MIQIPKNRLKVSFQLWYRFPASLQIWITRPRTWCQD